MHMKRLLIAVALTSSVLLSGVAAAKADTTVTVTAANFASGGHLFTSDTRGTGTGVFVFGPAGAPIGSGSFQLSTPDTNAKVQLFTDVYSGTPLSTIQGIGYSTYQVAPIGSPAMVGLNIRVDLNGDTVPDAYMVFEPYQDLGNAAIVSGTWQNWDAYRGGAAKWWISNGGSGTGVGGCGQNTPCTWNQILVNYPSAAVREGISCGNATFPKPVCPGSIGLNQGSSNAGAISNADALYVTLGGVKTIFDLEPTPDTTKPSCGSLVVHRGAHDTADVTVSDAGSGIASITNFTVTNGSASIPAFSPGAPSVAVTANKTVQGVNTHFEFDVTDVAGNTTHCV
jgi:hypothetical protein